MPILHREAGAKVQRQMVCPGLPVLQPAAAEATARDNPQRGIGAPETRIQRQRGERILVGMVHPPEMLDEVVLSPEGAGGIAAGCRPACLVVMRVSQVLQCRLGLVAVGAVVFSRRRRCGQPVARVAGPFVQAEVPGALVALPVMLGSEGAVAEGAWENSSGGLGIFYRYIHWFLCFLCFLCLVSSSPVKRSSNGTLVRWPGVHTVSLVLQWQYRERER